MTQFERSSNIREQFMQRALLAIVPGVVAAAIGWLLVAYQSMFVILGHLLVWSGVAAIVWGVLQIAQARKVPSFAVKCPFCQHSNDFTEKAMADVRCEGCQRMIPISDGVVLHVSQVRCGYCNHLNFYSEKSTGLICENCNRVVPIASEGTQAEKVFEAYTVHDDNQPYDLVLMDPGPEHNEDLVSALQHMLALNRNQVKEILSQTPTTLLTGIPKKKAELLKAQIDMHRGKADSRPTV